MLYTRTGVEHVSKWMMASGSQASQCRRGGHSVAEQEGQLGGNHVGLG